MPTKPSAELQTRNPSAQFAELENEPSLQEWLEEQKATCMWATRWPAMAIEPEFSLSLWRFPNGRKAIVQVALDGRGWEIYPAIGASDIDDALTAAEDALQLPPTR